MKTTLLIIAIAIISFSCQADTFTCSSHPIGGAQFADLSSAYSACAASGDTIILENSPLAYVLFESSWNKNITVIGMGGNVNAGEGSSIFAISNNSQISPNGSGSSFYGIRFAQAQDIFIESETNDITFENCYFGPTVGLIFQGNHANISVLNSVFIGVNDVDVVLPSFSTLSASIVFLNCIFNGSVDGGSGVSHAVTFDHCIFMNIDASGDHISNLKNAIISNSFFLNGPNTVSFNTLDCTFLNNIVENSQTMPPAGNSGSGNITGTAPIFTNYFLGNSYLPNQDYSLDPSSIGVNGASDGTDIGVHGGLTHFNEALEPSINPKVTSVVIPSAITEVGGTIEVNVQARKPLPE